MNKEKIEKSNKLFRDLIAYRTYCKFINHLGRKESLEETITRNMTMMLDKFPKLSSDIVKAYKYVYDFQLMPSMRSLQFAGLPILKNNTRLYNCSYLPINDVKCFSEVLFLLLSGTGVGFSVQRHHVNQLPTVKIPREENVYIVHDSIEGWAEALNVLMEAYFFNKIKPVFDFSKIRSKGTLLSTTGAKAPGSKPLENALTLIEQKLRQAAGRKLKPIEVHDIICIASECVLAGGIRRSALISLFDRDDSEMLKAKSGEWWVNHPYRARANNSAVLPRHEVTKEEFNYIFDICQKGGSGEPGFSWSNNLDMGFNPCKPLYSTILTNKGYITFEQALKMDSLVVMGIDGKWKKASRPFKTGEKRKIYKVTLSDGTSLYGTDNHLHMTANGEWKRLDELKVGDKLKISMTPIYNNTEIENKEEYESGLICGWVYGDGWFNKRKDRKNEYRVGMCFGVNKFDVAKYFSELLNVKIKSHAQKPNTCLITSKGIQKITNILLKYEMNTNKSDLTWLYVKSKDFKIGFIKALFTANGSVRKQNNVELYSIHREALEILSRVFKEFGVFTSLTTHSKCKSYIAKYGKIRNNDVTYKLNVYAGQFKKFGLICEHKNKLLNSQKEKSIYRRKDYVTIKAINPEYDIQDVYDITVYDESHAFIDSGVITHNCHEISLQPYQFCNLVTINAGSIKNEKDFYNKVYSASLIATLQASFTDFHYLRPVWKETTEREALIGVSMSGIADNYSIFNEELLKKGAELVKFVNEKYAKKIGINLAARTTTIKPEGTTSCIFGSSSGIHARHARYYLRRIRINKGDELDIYLRSVIPNLVEDDIFDPNSSVVVIPQVAPENSITREKETALSLLNRAYLFNKHWVHNGHRFGDNKNNVSCTISVKENEWIDVRESMWENRDLYSGISLLPYDGGTYKQAPFEETDEETIKKYLNMIEDVNLTDIKNIKDMTNNFGETIACGGGLCELT
jgi:hypothetical protein